GINLVASATAPTIKSKQTSNSLKMSVTNLGTASVSPITTENVSMTVQVGDGDSVELTPDAAKAIALNPNKSKTYSFTWTHDSIPSGTIVSITVHVEVPGNTAENTTDTATVTVL